MTYTPIETWSVLAPALERTGMTADEASLVMGGNMARVAREVWGRASSPGEL
jgi:membrane dipeptidase